MLNVLYVDDKLISTLQKGTSRKLEFKPGLTMDTEILELYEDYMVKSKGLGRPNHLIDLFCSINTYDLIDIEDKEWTVNIHHLTLTDVKTLKTKMTLHKKILTVSDQRLEFFKVITGANRVVLNPKY